MNSTSKLFPVLLVALSLLQPGASAARTYGLIVGIDDYAHVNKLDGAVNDARDIASALTGRGADVTLLVNADATRANIIGGFRRIVAQTRPGDVIVFSFAGHGTQMPEKLVGDEADGKDEVFILYGFWTEGPGVIERIRDNDIAALFAEVPKDVTILFIADSCHSGTMTRAPDPRGNLGRSRYVDVGPIRNDTLEAPDPKSFQVDVSDMDNVIFAAAARDDQETPEVMINGRYRGALSWSVAQALRGAADGGDGVTTLAELRTYVRSQVRAWSEARQTPDVTYSEQLGTGDTVAGKARAVIDLMAAAAEAPPAPTASGEVGNLPMTGANAKPYAPATDAEVASAGPAASADPPALAAKPMLVLRDAGPASGLDGLADVARITDAPESADLLWDGTTHQLVDRMNADPIAEAGDVAELRSAIQKWRTVRGLIRWMGGRPLFIDLDSGDERYRLGQEVWVRIQRPAPEFRYVTLVNLASTGEVQFVFPSEELVRTGADVIGPSEAEFRVGPAPVVPPTGADDLVAIVSRERLDDLHAMLDGMDGKRTPEAILPLLERYAGRPQDARIGYVPILTER